MTEMTNLAVQAMVDAQGRPFEDLKAVVQGWLLTHAFATGQTPRQVAERVLADLPPDDEWVPLTADVLDVWRGY